MQKQKIKIWKKILLSAVGIVTAFTMTFASNFVIQQNSHTAYAATITCVDADGKETEMSAEACPEGQTLKSPSIIPSSQKENFSKIIDGFIFFQQWLNSLIWPVFMMIGGLINNEMIFNNGMEQRLYDIWVQIRNLVNIVFVIVLVGIALYSVLGINSESSQYSIKTMLPKLIVGIIAVNFSFLAIKVMLDATTVITTAIFAIPSQTEQALGGIANSVVNPKDKDFVKELCFKLYNADSEKALKESLDRLILVSFASQNKIKTAQKTEAIEAAIKDNDLQQKWEEFKSTHSGTTESTAMCDSKGGLTPVGEKFLGKFNSNNAALAMAINMGGVLFADKASALKPGTDIMTIGVSVAISFTLNIIYLFAFLTLFLVLVARLIVVWISLAFSPVIAFGLTVPGVGDKIEMFKTIQDSFVKHLTAPIVISISMTIGWIMIGTINGMATSSVTDGVMDKLIPGLPIPELETMQTLIAAICTAAVVWMGATGAAKGTYVEGMVDAVGGQLKRLGTFVGKAPFLYSPIFPVQIKTADGTTRNATIDEVIGGGANFVDQFKRKQREGATLFGQQILGVDENSKTERDINKDTDPKELISILSESIKSGQFNKAEDYKRIAQALQANSGGTMRDILKNSWSISKDDNERKFAEKALKAMATGELTDTEGAEMRRYIVGLNGKYGTKQNPSDQNITRGKDESKTGGESKPTVDPKVSNAAKAAGVAEAEAQKPENAVVTAIAGANTIFAGIKKTEDMTQAKANEIAAKLKVEGVAPEAQKKAAESLVNANLPEADRKKALDAINKAIDEANKPAAKDAAAKKTGGEAAH